MIKDEFVVAVFDTKAWQDNLFGSADDSAVHQVFLEPEPPEMRGETPIREAIHMAFNKVYCGYGPEKSYTCILGVRSYIRLCKELRCVQDDWQECRIVIDESSPPDRIDFVLSASSCLQEILLKKLKGE